MASELGRLLRPLKGMCHVNIIPLNPTAGYKGGPSMADAVNQFVEVLARNGVPATPRWVNSENKNVSPQVLMREVSFRALCSPFCGSRWP